LEHEGPVDIRRPFVCTVRFQFRASQTIEELVQRASRDFEKARELGVRFTAEPFGDIAA